MSVWVSTLALKLWATISVPFSTDYLTSGTYVLGAYPRFAALSLDGGKTPPGSAKTSLSVSLFIETFLGVCLYYTLYAALNTATSL